MSERPEAKGNERRLPALLWTALAALLLALAASCVARFLRGQTGDFVHFYEGARAIRDGRDLYNSGTGGYIYPALLAFLFQPLAGLTRPAAAVVWLAVNTALLGVSVVVGVREFRRRLPLPNRQSLIAAAALLAAALTADKFRALLDAGQTDALMIACWVIALRFLDRRPWLAGSMIGLAMSVKYVGVVALLYFIVRGRWRAAAGTIAAFVLMLLLPALSVGWDTNLDYINRAFGGLGRMVGATEALTAGAAAANVHGLTWARSVSVTSAVARAVESIGGGRIWVVMGVAVAALGVLLWSWRQYHREGIALWRRGQAQRESQPPLRGVVAVEWSGLVIAAMAFSPQTEARHMSLMLIPHLLGALLALSLPPGKDRRRVIAALVLMQAALLLPPGGRAMDEWVIAWRALGGAGWCSLAMFLMLLGASLRSAKRSTVP